MAVRCAWFVMFGAAWRCLVALGGAWWCLVVLCDWFMLRGGACCCLWVLGGAWWCLVLLGAASCFLLLAACRLPLAAYRVLLAACRVPRAAYRLPLTMYCLPFTVRLLLTACSSLTWQVSPWLFYENIFKPCFQCYDFEVTDGVGGLLGGPGGTRRGRTHGIEQRVMCDGVGKGTWDRVRSLTLGEMTCHAVR